MMYQAGEIITITIPKNLSARSLLSYVASRSSLNIRRAAKLFHRHAVQIDGAIIKIDDLKTLPRGTIIKIIIPENWLPHLAATPIDLDIIYEDDYLLALNKPAGIVAHPARGHLHGHTLQNGVLHYYRDIVATDKVIAPPHRLDKNTSGVLLFSRTHESYRRLCALMAKRAVHKTYLAIAEGVATWDNLTVDVSLGWHAEIYGVGAIVPIENGGKKAITEFHVLQRGANWTLIEARPQTGRSHQIRLHLRHCGLPIIGDRDYNLHSRINFPRQALHASALSFIHPFTNQAINITAKLPVEMQEFIATLSG